jgi:cysteine desulfurase/selenocysteine lyase
MGGGDMIKEVWTDHATWNDLPYKFEAGTPNITGAIAFGAAIDYLERIGMDRVRAHEIELTGYALQRLKDRFPVSFFMVPPIRAQRGGVVSFDLPGDPFPRRGDHFGSGRGGHSGRAPLLSGVDAETGHFRHRPGQFLSLQHP